MPTLQFATRSVRLAAVTILVTGVTAAAVPTAVARTGSAAASASSTVTGRLFGVAAVSARSAWAVGSGTDGALILRWNGTSWSQLPSPAPGARSVLDAVAATSARNAWAVGSSPAGNALIVHWNGSVWQQVPAPAGSATLTSVAATSVRN